MERSCLIQIQKEYDELCESEKEIKEGLKNIKYFEGNFNYYGLLDHSWYQNYKKYLLDLLSGKQLEKLIFIKNDARVKSEKKMFCFIKQNKNFEFNFIKDFELVTYKYLSFLFQNYGFRNLEVNIFLFYIMIGGECMICGDARNKRDIYITYYEENKNNKLDFWLFFEDEEQKKLHLNLILTYNLWHYLGIINFNYNDEKKDIFDDKGKKVGFLVNNCEQKRSLYLDKLKKENLVNSTQYQQVKRSTIINIELIPKTISILSCLSLFNEFQNELFSYSKDNRYQTAKLLVNFYTKFQKMNLDNETNAISGLLTINATLSQTLTEIINLINEEYFEINKEIEKDPKINDYDENLGKNKILEKRKKGSIIQRLFYSIMENKVYCYECSLTSYNFEYFKFLDIDLQNERNPILLTNVIFKTKNIENKHAQCSFCNKKTNSKLERFISDFSNILIVIFKESHLNHFDQFNLQDNLILTKDNNISYKLVSFIEVITNVVYFKGQNDIWNKYLGNNVFETVENIEKLKPIILFYKLSNESINPNNTNKPNMIDNRNNKNNENINFVNQNINTNNNNNKLNMNNMGMNNMNNMFMNNMGINNMNKMGMNNIGMFNMGINNMNNIGTNNMVFNNMNNVGMNNMNNFGMNNMRMNNMNNFGMNNMNNMGMNNMNNIGMNNMNNIGMNNMLINNTNNAGMNNNMNNTNIAGINIMNNMGMNNTNNAGMNNTNNVGMNNMEMNNMNNAGMNNMGMNNTNNAGMNNMNNVAMNNMNNMGMNINNKNAQMMNNNGNMNNKTTNVNKTIFLTFTFEAYNKQIFIDVDENEIFQNLIKELEDKYNWLKSIKNRSYFYQSQQIKNLNLSIKELNIPDNSNIIIKIKKNNLKNKF